jgi:hypothetical protein
MQAESILSYLDGKARDGFTGGIRMGFEDGRPHSFAETDNPDTTIAETKAEFDIGDKLKTACTPKYYGTLFLVYDHGRITHFCSNKTMNGKVLEEMLQSHSPQPPRQRRVAVVVKRGRCHD